MTPNVLNSSFFYLLLCGLTFLLISLQSHGHLFWSTCLYHPRYPELPGLSRCYHLCLKCFLSCAWLFFSHQVPAEISPLQRNVPGKPKPKWCPLSPDTPTAYTHTHTHTHTQRYSVIPSPCLYFSLHLQLCLIVWLIICLPSKMSRFQKKACSP